MTNFTPKEVDCEIESMKKFAKNRWSYGDKLGILTPRGQSIQRMLKAFKRECEKPAERKFDNLPGQITRAINLFDAASQDYSMIGSAHPDDMYDIEQDYKKYRQQLEATILRALNK